MNHDPSANRTHADIHRASDGGIDTEYHLRVAHRLRADSLRAVVSCIARYGLRAWSGIKAGMQAQKSSRTLSRMSVRELKDIGLTRSDIESVANGAYFIDSTRSERKRARRRAA